MARKKTKRQSQMQAADTAPRHASVHPQWVAFTLIIGLAFGGVVGYFVGSAVSAGDAAAMTDQYGRSPGHPHYRHNHP